MRRRWDGDRLETHAAEEHFSRHPAARARGRAVHYAKMMQLAVGASGERAGVSVSGSSHLAGGARVGPGRVQEVCLVSVLIQVHNCASPIIADVLSWSWTCSWSQSSPLMYVMMLFIGT